MKIRHVLLATDLSPLALEVLPTLENMLGEQEVELTLLHVVPVLAEHTDSTLGTPLALPDYERDRTSAQQVLEEQAKDLDSRWNVSIQATTGSRVAEKIAAVADEIGADWIALTTHARKGLRRFILGSVAEGVLRHAGVPVVCLSPDAAGKASRIRHILIPSDLSDEAMRPFGPALELARHLEARVSVLHVVPELAAIPHGAPLAPPLTPADTGKRIEEARRDLAARCEGLDNRVDLSLHVISNESAAQGIADFVSSKNVDLIAISTHGRTGFRRFTLGSVAEEVVRRSPVPVFGFHRRDED